MFFEIVVGLYNYK